MNYIFETLIIIGVSLFMIMFTSLICFRDEHFFIRHKGVEEKHYVLKKTKFLFLPAYAITWNWKTGVIRKSTLWGLFGFYIYFLGFYISDLVYYLVSNSNLILKQPIVFIVVAVVVPLAAIIAFAVSKTQIKYAHGKIFPMTTLFQYPSELEIKRIIPKTMTTRTKLNRNSKIERILSLFF